MNNGSKSGDLSKKLRIKCEVSMRHVHLSEGDSVALFGKKNLTPARELSQPNQFLCVERVDIITEKGLFKNVAIIGPMRPKTQIEISKTDSFALGLKETPLRESGKTECTAGVLIVNSMRRDEVLLGDGSLSVLARDGFATPHEGVIIAKRHVHLDEKTALEYDLADGEHVAIVFDGERGGVLDNAVVRVSDKFAPAVHIDSDEGNAMGFSSGDVVVRKYT